MHLLSLHMDQGHPIPQSCEASAAWQEACGLAVTSQDPLARWLVYWGGIIQNHKDLTHFMDLFWSLWGEFNWLSNSKTWGYMYHG